MSSIPETEVLRQIQEGAGDVRAAGTALAERIKQFDAWLNRLPGRVYASTEISSSPDGIESTHLSFSKDGKAWSLFLSDFDSVQEEFSNRRLLRDASLDEKATAVACFPLLLREMAESQKRLVARLKLTADEYDVFAKRVGIKEGE